MEKKILKVVLLFVIKLSIVPSLLLVFALCSYAKVSFSQGALDKAVSLRVKDRYIADILYEIENKSAVKFAYSPEIVQSNKKSSLDVVNKPVKDVLGFLFDPSAIRFEERNNVIILSRVPAEKIVGKVEKVTITGKVTDEQKNPLSGVSVLVKGTTIGVTTDADGNFKITLDKRADLVLVVSYVGFTPQEISVGDLYNLEIVLKSENKTMNDVVVVGYGTQSKSKVTGAISTVKSDYLQNRPITNVSSGLAGSVPGLSINAANGGAPGSTPAIAIRGTTTLNSAGALVLVDGVESRLQDVDPNIIQEISVLKDASAAAIYGSKAANGVIMVTTKSGIAGQATKIDYAFNGGTQKPTALPEMVNAIDYINLKNKAQEYEALYFNKTTPPPTPYFSDAILEKARNGELANTNWGKELYKANAFQMNHALNVSGSGNKSDYFIGLGYLDQDGINVGVDKFTRYNLRAKINTRLKDWLTVGTNTAFTHRSFNNLPAAGTQSGRDLRSSPLFPVATSDGMYISGEGGAAVNPIMIANSGSFSHLKENIFETQLLARADIGKHFSVEEKFSVRIFDSKGAVWRNAIDYVTQNVDENGYEEPILIPAQSVNRAYSESDGRVTHVISQSTMKYDRRFNDHATKILVGFQTENYRSSSNNAGRIDYLNGSLQTLDLGAAVDPSIGNGTGNTSSATAYKMASTYGRLNYDYRNKYLVEGSFRLDGSSRFTGANQYGFFPSVSVGWNIAEENFIEKALPFISQLKLRASVGTLGDAFSGGIGNYDFYQTVVKTPGYSFAGGSQPGLATGKAANPNITWEKATITDAGLDISMFRNKLGVVFDYFINNRSNILVANPAIASEFGLPAPSLNGASVRSQGFEIEVTHRNKVGDFSYFIAANLANQRNKVTGLGASAPSYGNTVTDIGYAVNAFYGYVADGFITSSEDLAAYTSKYKISGPSIPYVGSLKFKDLNGDNIIDPQNDRTIINDNTPHFNAGLRLGGSYKAFSLSVNIAGVLDQTTYFGANQSDLFFSGGVGAPYGIQKSYFDPQNADATLNAYFPVLRSGLITYDRSSFWLREAGFLRMKNITLNYEVNKDLLKRVGVSRLNLYASAENPFLIWTNYFASDAGWDPELGSSAVIYPLTKTFSIGLNLTL